MTPINEIDPLSQRLNPQRVLELAEAAQRVATEGTARQEKELLRLVTAAYLAGLEDGSHER